MKNYELSGKKKKFIETEFFSKKSVNSQFDASGLKKFSLIYKFKSIYYINYYIKELVNEPKPFLIRKHKLVKSLIFVVFFEWWFLCQNNLAFIFFDVQLIWKLDNSIKKNTYTSSTFFRILFPVSIFATTHIEQKV